MQKKIRLSMVGVKEDVPRLVRAYSRYQDGEVSLMLRPRSSRCLFVVLRNDQAWWWRSEDCPQWPSELVEPSTAIEQVDLFRKRLPRASPVTLRGQWSGDLFLDNDDLTVTFRRRITPYGSLVITSSASGWIWRYDRQEKWFTDEATSRAQQGSSTLLEAVTEGIEGSMGLVREACSQRDTRRRAAYDPTYAQRYPIRTREPTRDPTERLGRKPRRSRQSKRSAKGVPSPIDERTPAPAAPVHTEQAKERAEALGKEATRLSRLPRISDTNQDTMESIAAWFEGNGLAEVGHRLITYEWDSAFSPSVYLEILGEQLEMHLKQLHSPVQSQAKQQLERFSALLNQIPYAVRRSRMLILQAESLVSWPLCTGADREDALAAIERAKTAYERARLAFESDEEENTRWELLRIGEDLAVVARRISAACASADLSCGCDPVPPDPQPAAQSQTQATGSSEPDAAKDRLIFGALDDAIRGLGKELSR